MDQAILSLLGLSSGPSATQALPTQAILSLFALLWLFIGCGCGYLLGAKGRGGGGSNQLLLGLLTGAGLKRALLAVHGIWIIREIWQHFTTPGTARQLCRALFKWFCGKGWRFDFPEPAGELGSHSICDDDSEAEDNWYVTAKDLAFYKHHALGKGELEGAGPWELMMEKEVDGVTKYTAYRRTLPCGKVEYKSITVSANATKEEFMDVYLDDDFRPHWDGMIIEHDVLEHGDFAQRQQVVRWRRRFPFSFISDREYTIARRVFREEGWLFGITKSIQHPRAVRDERVVKMDVYHSMWGIRDVECPWGSGQPACETILLHHEQFKIPENLSRFAVRHGMWGFVRNLSTKLPTHVAMRRQRCGPHESDPSAYGSGFAPNPPPSTHATMARASTCTTDSLSLLSEASDMDGLTGSEHSPRGGAPMPRSSSLRALSAFAIASGVAMLLKRGASAGRDMGGAGSAAGQASLGSSATGAGSKQSSRHMRHRQRYTSFESL